LILFSLHAAAVAAERRAAIIFIFFSGSGTIIPVYEERRKSLESQLAQTSGKDSRIIE
jgi:hypothetical protein